MDVGNFFSSSHLNIFVELVNLYISSRKKATGIFCTLTSEYLKQMFLCSTNSLPQYDFGLNT